MQEIYATWSMLTEPGDTLAGYLRRNLGVSNALEMVKAKLPAKEILKILPQDQFLAPNFPNTLQESLECYWRRLKVINPDKAISTIHELGGELIPPSSWHWPKQLSDLADGAPAVLWVWGDKDVLLKQPALSVIGSRLASSYGLNLTRDMVRFAVNQDWLIVSGGALGIDAMASNSAIGNQGKTVAVMAGGLDSLYPSNNRLLFEEIKTNGALISEVAPGTSASRWRFLQRNRLIAALGNATLVVEAGFRSGSINTAGHANEIGRPVGAVPGPIDSVRSAGCHRLIREGRAELIATPAHLKELMGVTEIEQPYKPQLNSTQIRALDAVKFGVFSFEQIATSSGLTTLETELALRQLESENLLVRKADGWQKP